MKNNNEMFHMELEAIATDIFNGLTCPIASHDVQARERKALARYDALEEQHRKTVCNLIEAKLKSYEDSDSAYYNSLMLR